MIKFESKEQDLVITFPTQVIASLQKHRQTGNMNESGGMLFTNDLESSDVLVSYASMPTASDKRGKWFFKSNTKSTQSIIRKQFKKGHHYIGDWHSHSEKNPYPSPKDKRTFKQVFSESEHQLRFMAMLILGSEKEFSNSYVSLIDKDNIYR